MAEIPPDAPATTAREARVGAGSLRVRTARGTIVNGVFLMGVQALSLVRGLVVAAFLTREEYGVWGIVLTLYLTVWTLRQLGIGERFVQQDDEDDRAFQSAFTVDLLAGLAFAVLGVPIVIGLATLYGTEQVILPGLLILAVLPLQSLQMPLAIFYRRMDFLRQRILQSAEPVFAFALTLGLAIAGHGYWSLVIGTIGGALLGAIVGVIASPVRLRFVLDRAELPAYFSFSWPFLVFGLSGIVLSQGTILVANDQIGLAGVGVIALCAVVSQVADRASRAITDTMYPALCAVKDRLDLMHESFVTSNRLALMWAVPFGIGVALFSEDLLVGVFGEEWRSGVDLLRATALSLAIQQIAFNWVAFFRARGETWPMAVAGLAGVATFFVVIAPLLIAYELDGLALGVLLSAPVTVAVRFAFLRRLFPRIEITRHVTRALAPSVLPAAVVLGLRAMLEGEARGLPLVGAELLLYIGLTGLCTWLLDRDLLREAGGYLRGRAVAA